MDAVVTSGGHQFEVTNDLTARFTVFVRGAVSDDSGDLPVDAPFAVTVDEPLLRATDHDASYALAGDPDVALADTSIAHPLTVTIRAAGYRSAVLPITVPANPVLPLDFPIELRREPVRVSGRVTLLASGAPITNSQITITGPPLPAPRRAVLLGQPLTADLSPTAKIRGRNVTAVASPVPIKTARMIARAGEIEILVDDRRNLAPGQLLELGPPERSHWAEIASVSTSPANQAQPGTVQLVTPLARTVADGDPAAPFTLGTVSGPLCNPVGEALVGESVVVLDGMPTGAVALINDAPAPRRFHSLGARSGAAGDYAIDGLARLSRPELRIAAPGFASQTRPLPLPRRQSSVTLDWRLSP